MPLNRRQALTAGAVIAAIAAVPRLSRAQAPSALSAEERAVHALNRLAYGPTPADMAALRQQGAAAWLDAWLQRQLQPESLPQPAALSDKLASLEVLRKSQGELLALYREAHKENRSAKREAAQGRTPEADAQNAVREQIRPLVAQAATARLTRALQSPAQLQEVLVEFWFNHFNVFAGKGPVGVLVADYENRAIRPHVLGRFRDMLGATAKHPAMLIYLDNLQSVVNGYQAPHRRRALVQDKPKAPTGLNENYARELMELHTLGVDGGYSQRDVTELARMLTGWTIDPRAAQREAPDLFGFDPHKHDAGSKTWLGRSVVGAGQAEGERALDVLASHPATARHIAYQFAQAFVADEPPASLVSRLADNFKATGGDLRELTRKLIGADEFWSREAFGAKFKTPYQYLLSSLRAVGSMTPPIPPLLQALAQAGQPLYGSVTPDGYKNTAAAWRNPEALTQRVQLASTVAARVSPEPLWATLGPLLSASTRQTIAGEPAAQQVALLLASPDFMRR